ncbi:MAG: hypothetical protein WED09_07080 [Homoserinimonas sp.]
MGAIRRYAAGVLIVLASATLIACTDAPEGPPSGHLSTAEPPSSAPEPEPEPDPELVPEGSAEENLPYFDVANSRFLADGNPGGRSIIDNLADAGFDKSAMEVTADRTPRGSDVDSLQFSVRIGDDCLLGQVDSGGYSGTFAPALASGTCLIGNTRAIDW